MRVIPGTLSVYWRRADWPPGLCCQADAGRLSGETPRATLTRYRETFPADVVVGAKDQSGRWVA